MLTRNNLAENFYIETFLNNFELIILGLETCKKVSGPNFLDMGGRVLGGKVPLKPNDRPHPNNCAVNRMQASKPTTDCVGTFQ